MIKVFDLDGTLLDSNNIWHEIDERFVHRRGLALTEEYTEFVSHAIFPVAARFTKDYYFLDESEDEIMAEWYEMAVDAYTHHLPLKPNVREYLDHCAQKGDKMIVYTSSVPDLCKAALERHKLLPYFEELYFAQELLLEKKYSASFSKIAERLGEKAENCLLFDDSPFACTAAKDAGWKVIGIREEFFAHHQDTLDQVCDLVITDFRELLG